MGNIRSSVSFDEIWSSDKANRVREQVKNCPKNCWMVGTASPVMKKYIKQPLRWVMANKWNVMTGKPVSLDID